MIRPLAGITTPGSSDRLLPDGEPRLEVVRTLELVGRHLAPTPADVLDVGGGPGVYASRLAHAGYGVNLIDPVAAC
jgi:2-polyprenyl-3-methyl-5-hydroxy-6-metoxy-1,4-benzoquinol methylase